MLSGLVRRRKLPAIDKNEFWALRDISFDVREGDVVGIIGRNGAGKSTLLKVLSRITEPTSGEIVTWGRVSSLLEVGTGFHPALTGRENIFLNGVILGMSRQDVRRRFDEIVAFAGVEKFIDTPVKRYSSGMRVRLAFAVAAHLESEILIVDEVLAVGDAEFQKKSLGKMEDIASKGRTVLFVSHDMSTIRSLCRTGVLLNAGRVEYQGDIDSTIDAYLNLYSALDQLGAIQTGSDVIHSFKTTREDGSVVQSFGHDEAIVLELEVKDPGASEELVFGVQVCAMPSMTKIFLTRYQARLNEASSRVLITVPPDVLVPGEYAFNAGVSDLSRKVIDLHEGIARFRVVDRGCGLNQVRPSEIGHVRVPCRWSQRSVHVET